MRAGIDWLSLVLVVAAFALSRIRSLSLRTRYAGMALLFALLTASRLRLGDGANQAGVNGLLTLFAALVTVYYAGRAIASARR